MVKFFLKIFIVVFLMESTWAVAAQYCPHELGLKVYHSYKQVNNDKNQTALATIGADHSKPDTDNDCPYCNLGSMKSMLSMLSLPSGIAQHTIITAIDYTYPDIVPRQLDRPNWPAAV